MANTAAIPRGHLIYGVCLPIAVLLGYLLASPYDSGSVAVVVMLVSILSIPILLRWHHAILIFSINAPIMLLIPGRPMLWSLMTVLCVMLLILNRAIQRDVNFFQARGVAFSLLFFGLVVFATAYMTGGIQLGALGGRSTGGKRYLFLMCGIFTYFALACNPIPRKYARAAIGAFFLSSLVWIVGYFAAFGGPSLYFLVELFPIEGAVGEINSMTTDTFNQGFTRFGEVGVIGIGVACYLLARFGIKGVLDLSKPWRVMLLLLTVLGLSFSGFRSDLILFAVIFAIVFYLEGLLRTRYFLAFSMVGFLTLALVVPFAQKLPLAVQRTIAFLPIEVDPMIRGNTDASTEWRIQMWQEILPTVPKYLIKGKGYNMDSSDALLIQTSEMMGFSKTYDSAIIAGDYHSGPLSVIIPFGIFGAIAFGWFVIAAGKVLYGNYKFGDPALHGINVMLLALFIGRLLMYIFIFGSLYSDFYLFTATVGLSVSLNGVRRPQDVTFDESTGLTEQTSNFED